MTLPSPHSGTTSHTWWGDCTSHPNNCTTPTFNLPPLLFKYSTIKKLFGAEWCAPPHPLCHEYRGWLQRRKKGKKYEWSWFWQEVHLCWILHEKYITDGSFYSIVQNTKRVGVQLKVGVVQLLGWLVQSPPVSYTHLTLPTIYSV